MLGASAESGRRFPAGRFGSWHYPTTIGVRGGRYLVSFNAETRKRTGRGAGDEVDVELVVDPERDSAARG
ncbi:DUF1905 domain-containing protein [Nocardia vermiculata]|uniref:DUF1905 domain-containing protein n=1 Tax=Nocardia vermiculata TaxID=257274 RepID=A0A846Y7Z5_9NOCA|nr:DUF1905 domain-containing protein [Nocardia vermiculata]